MTWIESSELLFKIWIGLLCSSAFFILFVLDCLLAVNWHKCDWMQDRFVDLCQLNPYTNWCGYMIGALQLVSCALFCGFIGSIIAWLVLMIPVIEM